jgi:D-3-phosphoglycerate dehydrogenase
MKILVTARSFRQTEGPHQQILKDAGHEVLNSSQDRPLKAAELAALVGDVAGLILGLDEVTSEVLDEAGSLRVISRYGVGVDNIDLEAATSRGIVVTNTPGANTLAVAELTITLMLALARRIPYHDRIVKQGGWTRISGTEMAGRTLGIVGIGRIGREVAKRALGFGIEILYHDPVPPPQEFLASVPATYRSLQDLVAESDFVSLHCPLTDDTRNLIDRSLLGRFKPSAYLVNTARGGLVNEQALYAALAGGALAGAACDVFTDEPPTDSPLVELDNFIATPHIGSTTVHTALRMGLMASQNALAALRGERPANVVNPEVYEQH